jgi:type IV secretory pathway VirB10-like protein
MKRINALLIVIAVAVAATAGMFAALRTASLGAASTTPRVSDTQIARQNRALDRAEAALRAQARQQPPALPPKPAASPSAPVAAPTARRAQVVIYRRPPAVVRVVHRSGEHENEHESEHADHGEGLDD